MFPLPRASLYPSDPIGWKDGKPEPNLRYQDDRLLKERIQEIPDQVVVDCESIHRLDTEALSGSHEIFFVTLEGGRGQREESCLY